MIGCTLLCELQIDPRQTAGSGHFRLILRVDSNGLPVRLALSAGEAHDVRLSGKRLSRLKSGSMLFADRGYDADWPCVFPLTALKTPSAPPHQRPDGAPSSSRTISLATWVRSVGRRSLPAATKHHPLNHWGPSRILEWLLFPRGELPHFPVYIRKQWQARW